VLYCVQYSACTRNIYIVFFFYCRKKLVQSWNYFLCNTKVFDTETNYSYIKTVDQKFPRASFHYLLRDTNQHLRIFLCSFPLRPMVFRLFFTLERSLLIQGCQKCQCRLYKRSANIANVQRTADDVI